VGSFSRSEEVLKSSGTDLIKVPTQELGRQAIRSFGGYIYQVYQTVAAWLDLREGGVLFVEVTEDFSTLVGDLLTQTQVKDINSGAKLSETVQLHWHCS
jgi:hypothetical protein